MAIRKAVFQIMVLYDDIVEPGGIFMPAELDQLDHALKYGSSVIGGPLDKVYDVEITDRKDIVDTLKIMGNDGTFFDETP